MRIECNMEKEYLEIVKEWHPYKNGNLTWKEVTPGSHKRVWWKCAKGHEWESTIANRNQGYGCPYCSNQKVLPGYNDLSSKNPLLAREWNYERNGLLKPDDVTQGSSKKVWWKCVRGHEWEDSINHRSSGRGCPVCNRGLKTSFPEQAVFYYVSQMFDGVVNRYTDLGFELDIFIPHIRLGIEYDGGIYHQNEAKELRKISACRDNGINLIKIREPECRKIYDKEVKSFELKNHSTKELQRIIVDLVDYLKVTYNVEKELQVKVEEDNIKILQMIGVYERENSVSVKRPDLAEEWDYEKNGELLPTMIGGSSSQKVWWKCPRCKNSWRQSPNARRIIGSCPKCSRELVEVGVNDVVTKRSELIKEWDYIKNSLTPENYSNISNKEVWWVCSICNNNWKEAISKRNRKIRENGVARCPKCEENFKKRPQHGWMNRELEIIENSIASDYPMLIEEWDYEANGNIRPENVSFASTYRASWICPKGHKYVAIVNNRTTKNSGCPYCSNQKLLKGFNDFATTCKYATEEWMREKNLPDTPESIISGNKKYWWKCQVCGYEWNASASSRKYGSGCPNCAKENRRNQANKKVGQYSLETGELIKVYSSVKEAEKAINNKNIGSVCSGKRKSAGGYFTVVSGSGSLG